MSDFIAFVGLVVGCVSAYFAWKAYAVSREISFPKRNAHKELLYIRELTKGALDFNSFFKENVDKRVYISVHFDSEDIEYQEFKEKKAFNVTVTMTIWIDSFSKVEEGDTLSGMNSTSLYVQICDDYNRHLYWENGGYTMKGYFAVEAYGTKQGHHGVLLKPLSIN
ncbi:hypothetical protein [Yersinia enterocolitica]|uniref:hypothetical protein n=1 Tax=Yersinia enterocolitica TaxID=630 RepID=UPI0005E94EC0|nr:hypothetical protein [Yersinia enterocolitica]CQH41877.1 Uncharacterised protein [Yersinia enterocolitica]